MMMTEAWEAASGAISLFIIEIPRAFAMYVHTYPPFVYPLQRDRGRIGGGAVVAASVQGYRLEFFFFC
jgi:hypothetical protein